MVGILCEHFGGKWPFWLSPRQCLVIPVSEETFEYATYVRENLHACGFHVEARLGDERLNKKIRDAQFAQWNYILVVGREEEQKRTVSVRERSGNSAVSSVDLAEFIARLDTENRPGA